jgi:hypothetical protein
MVGDYPESDDIAIRAMQIWNEISHDGLEAVAITCCLAKACLRSCHPNDIEFIRELLSTADRDGAGATKH